MSSTVNIKPVQRTAEINGATIAWAEWGEPGEPRVLLSHATGLHARCWDEVVAHLAGCHVIAPDHRGHGRSGNTPPHGWDQFGADLTDLIVHLDLREITGVGHSMGGHSMVIAAAREPDRFRQLILFDPVIFEPCRYAAPPDLSEIEHPVARRRNSWTSPQQMFESFKHRAPFSRWDVRVLRDYCEHGLVRDGDDYKLACPPDIEAGIYASSMTCDIYADVALVDIPVSIVRAESRGFDAGLHDFSLSPTWPELAGRFAKGRDVYLPDWSHFLPQENPELAASIITADL